MTIIRPRARSRRAIVTIVRELSWVSLGMLALIGASACSSEAPDEPLGGIGTSEEAATCSSACTSSVPCGTGCTQKGFGLNTSCGAAGLACTVGTKCTEDLCEAWGGDALAVCGKTKASCSTVNPEQGILCSDCDASSPASAICNDRNQGGWYETTCGETGVYQGMCSAVCSASAACDLPCGEGGLDNSTCGDRYSVAACEDDPSIALCATGGTCASWLSTHHACSNVCTWASLPSATCFDDELQTQATCDRYGVNREVSDCLNQPGHAGCSPLQRGMGSNGQPSQSYGTCNDGNTVAVVPDADSRTWGQLGGPRTAAGSEQNRIDTLMNNAALSIGCNLNQASQPTSDGVNSSETSFVKSYVNSSGKPASCGYVYFVKKLGCAFALSTSDVPPAGDAYRTSAKIRQLWASLGGEGGKLGLPTANPIGDHAGTPTVSWQRFRNGYITYRSPDASAYWVGGNDYVADRAVASAYGRLFDHGQDVNYWPLGQAMECAHPDAGKCAPGNTGRYTMTYPAVSSGADGGYPALLVSKIAGVRGYAVRGPLAGKWMGTPSTRPWLPGGFGFPTDDQHFNATISRYKQSFERALGVSGNSDPAMTWIVSAASAEAMASYGNALGAPTSAKSAVPGGGFSQMFAGGALFENAAGQVFAVEGGAHGPLTPYLQAGGPSGKWGWPLEGSPDFGTTAVALRQQRFNHGMFDWDLTLGDWEVFPPTVWMPAYPGARSHEPNTVNVGWYETGPNVYTEVYRTTFDSNGIAAPAKLVKSFTNIAQGNQSFVDSAATSADGSAPEPDKKHCYQVKEKANVTCSGSNCLTTPLAEMCAWGRAATPHSVGRVQLRLKVDSASTAEAVGAHVQVYLQSPYLPYGPLPQPRNNNTWLDSPKADFASGSNLTYDLNTGNIGDLSDITQITVRNVDHNWMCIKELELLVDNTRAFLKTFPSCQGVWESDEYNYENPDTETLSITHADLRASADWINFNPPNLLAANLVDELGGTKTFGGLRKTELISVLDTATADALRNPANAHGDGAGFLDNQLTTSSRLNYTHLRVQQHILAQNDGWWDGDTTAHPEFNLVIHNDDAAVCGSTSGVPRSCLRVENVVAHASYSGWNVIVLGSIGLGFPGIIGAQLYADHIANETVEGSLANTIVGLSEVNGLIDYCFPKGDTSVDFRNTVFPNAGFAVGSLTACFGPLPMNE